MSSLMGFIESHRDFPKKGVVYWDFTPLLKNPDATRSAVHTIKNNFSGNGITCIAAIESKGFILGAMLAYEMGLPLVLVRKPGLTPGEVIAGGFRKEYGLGEYQIKKNAVRSADNVLIVYDILAEAGAANAAIDLVKGLGAHVVGCAFAIELEYLKGREKIFCEVFSLVKIKERETK